MFKEIFIEKNEKYNINEIRSAMTNSGKFSQKQVMSDISTALVKITGRTVSPKEKYTWDEINDALTYMNISPAKIARVLTNIK